MNYGPKLVVHLNRLERNYQLIQEISKKPLIAMVKANAYGHGLFEISKFLSKDLGVNTLGVASIHEALALRKLFNDFTYRIFVFSNLALDYHLSDYLDEKIIPVISRLDDLETVLRFKKAKNLPLVLKFNTGMNRLGINYNNIDKLVALLSKYDRKEISHIMTHLADSFKVDASIFPDQMRVFEDIKSYLRSSGFDFEESSISNSALIERNIKTRGTHQRCGLLLYGAKSFKDSKWQGEMISELEANILEIRNLEDKEAFGYGPSFMKKKTKLGVLNIGYGDGIPSRGHRFSIPYHQNRHFITGRINMDMSFIELNGDTRFRIGDPFKIWGKCPHEFYDLCLKFKAIPYALLAQLTSRLYRDYKLP